MLRCIRIAASKVEELNKELRDALDGNQVPGRPAAVAWSRHLTFLEFSISRLLPDDRDIHLLLPVMCLSLVSSQVRRIQRRIRRTTAVAAEAEFVSVH